MQNVFSHIKRYPIRDGDPLQGWDSADELILKHIQSTNLEHQRILIINDHFGALSATLSDFDITSYTDSFVSYMATSLNTNGKISAINDLKKLSGVYNVVLVQIPKNLSFFEDILCQLSAHLDSSSQLIFGSMVKHLAPSSFELIQKYIGQTTTSLAQKKARLIFSKFEKTAVSSPYPREVSIEGFSHPFSHDSNLFSREKLDIGTRFFLEHIPEGDFKRILDLGCGNGIVGIKARLLNPESQIIFSDESKMAIDSAERNFKNYFDVIPQTHWINCFENQQKNSLDLVLCNPPFHQHHTIGDHIALQMFKDSFEALRKGGMIRVIGNSHLAYQVKLKKIFSNSRIVATNSKFIICEALKN